MKPFDLLKLQTEVIEKGVRKAFSKEERKLEVECKCDEKTKQQFVFDNYPPHGSWPLFCEKYGL